MNNLLLAALCSCIAMGADVAQGDFQRFVPTDLSPMLAGEYASDMGFKPAQYSVEGDLAVVEGIPFRVASDSNGVWRSIDLANSRWREQEQDPVDWGEGPDKDPRVGYVAFRLTMSQYLWMYLLAVADGRPGKEPAFGVRAGTCWRRRDYLADLNVRVPGPDEGRNMAGLSVLEGTLLEGGAERKGRVFMISVALPVGSLIKLARLGPEATFDVVLTRTIHLRVAAPDPNMFGRMPLGAPSGVRVFGVTFEHAPVTLDVVGKSTWNVFPPGVPVGMDLLLVNRTATWRTVELSAEWRQKRMEKPGTESWRIALAPGENKVVAHVPACPTFGCYDYRVTLKVEGNEAPLAHRTSFARLAPAANRPLEPGIKNRFCTWWWDGEHLTESEAGLAPLKWMGPGYVHHFRSVSPGMREKLKQAGIRIYMDDAMLMFHERNISGPHLMHYPKSFLGEPRYNLSAEEEATASACVKEMLDTCAKTRKETPDKKIFLGNSSFNFVEELLCRKVPAELFDAIGHEAPCFARMPERQPELASFQEAWWFRQALLHHGYSQGIVGCAEGAYHGTSPGNIGAQEQANLYVRDLLHGLAYGFDRISASGFEDVGDGYYFSNWGASGLFTRPPDVHPKRSYAAYAVACDKLSDVDFARAVPVGTHSAYLLEFKRRRGDRLFVGWTLRGRRPLTIKGSFAGAVQIVDQEGNAGPLKPHDGGVGVELSPAPCYIEGVAECKTAEVGAPIYSAVPASPAMPLAALDSLDGWELEEKADPVLDNGNFNMPRQKGTFDVRVVEDETRGKCLEFALKSATNRPGWIPAYQKMRLKTPIVITNVPTHIRLHVRGNSGWGRVIIELADAKGERWTSIGQPDAWNADDIESLSYIIHDGWRPLEIPLPGQYGSGYHWPRNCIWRNGMADKSGDGIVDYPLSLTGLVLEQRQKIVYVNEMVDASKEPVRISGLTAIHGDPEEVGEWEVRSDRE